jgi:hypothetical protein
MIYPAMSANFWTATLIGSVRAFRQTPQTPVEVIHCSVRTEEWSLSGRQGVSLTTVPGVSAKLVCTGVFSLNVGMPQYGTITVDANETTATNPGSIGFKMVDSNGTVIVDTGLQPITNGSAVIQ